MFLKSTRALKELSSCLFHDITDNIMNRSRDTLPSAEAVIVGVVVEEDEEEMIVIGILVVKNVLLEVKRVSIKVRNE